MCILDSKRIGNAFGSLYCELTDGLLTFHELVIDDVAQLVRQMSLLVVWNAWSGLKEVIEDKEP